MHLKLAGPHNFEELRLGFKFRIGFSLRVEVVVMERVESGVGKSARQSESSQK